jgi:hypothetical protein
MWEDAAPVLVGTVKLPFVPSPLNKAPGQREKWITDWAIKFQAFFTTDTVS